MIKTIESIEKWTDSKNYRIKGNITEFIIANYCGIKTFSLNNEI